ncbi:MAG: MATE family efflux transporter [Planctomycetes bacterium]|nr:MATE family efflux transporter [Planctomycetota bacterium]
MTATPGQEPWLSWPPPRAVFVLGLPLAIAMASHALINVVDLALIGRLGADAVAAAHVATTINFLPMILGQCVSIALLSRLSRQLGAGDVDRARTFHRRSEWFLFWLGIVIGVATALPAAFCVDTTGIEGTVRAAAIEYLVVCNLGCLPMFVLMGTTTAMRAVGETAMPLFLLLGANALNLGLDLVLLFGWPALGIPSLGVVGAAWATVIARVLAAVVAVAWLRRRGHPLSLRGTTATAMPVARPLLADAMPQVVQIGLRGLVVWGLTVAVQQRGGADALAAIGITTRLDTMVLFGAIGFASAATTIAGRAVMQGNGVRARAAGLWAGIQACLFGGVLIMLFWCCREDVVLLFLPQAGAGVVAAAALYLGVAALAHPIGAFALGAIGAVQGAGRMVAPMAVDLLGFAVLGVLLLTASHNGEGLLPVFWALVLGTAVLAAAHLTFLLRANWTRPVAPH